MFKLSKFTILVDQSKDWVILFNSFTGSVIRLEKETYIKISHESFNKEITPYFNALVKQGFIVHSSTDEYNMLQLLLRQKLNRSAPESLSYVIAPTLLCNLRCGYCFENNTFHKTKMSSDTMEKVIDFIVQQVQKIKSNKKIIITWFGGEPLLEFNLIVAFCEIIKKKLDLLGVILECHMVTNGVLLSKEKARVLSEKCNLSTVQITLDGTERIYAEKKGTNVGDYYAVIKNISECYSYFKINVRLNTDRTTYNENLKLTEYLYGKLNLLGKIYIYLAEVRDYCNDCSVNDIYYKYGEFDFVKKKYNDFLYKMGYTKSKLNIFPPIFSPNFCKIMIANNYAIDPDGYLYKCEHYIGNKEKAVGDVIWGVYYNKEYLETMNGHVYGECGDCALYPSCRVNCTAMREYITHGTRNCVIYDEFLKNIKNLVKLSINC